MSLSNTNLKQVQSPDQENSAWEVLTVDYQSPNAPQDFYKSLAQTGFAVIRNHTINYELFNKVSTDWQKFFSRSEEDKARFMFSHENFSLGFYPFGSENAKGYLLKNLMEYYHYTPQAPLPDGVGPETTQLYHQLFEMGRMLLSWLDDTLPAPIKAGLSRPLADMANDKAPQSLMRFLHYPPLTDIEVQEGAIRSAPHEDNNLLTLLCAATTAGLQVKDTRGTWHAVGTHFGEVIVNAADMLQIATKGTFRSTTHQVVNPTGEEARLPRYSMPMFISGKPDVILEDNLTADMHYRRSMQANGVLV